MDSGKATNQSLLIGDDLLIEILSRIPTTVVAIRCKLICKGWCSLISSPYFISRFKQQHIDHESRYPKPLLGMLANTVRRVSMENPDEDEFNFQGFNLDHLPEPKKNGKIYVLASCNDLILCKESYTCNYYLCNPFTMQWVALPPPPPDPTNCIKAGLVCEPYNGGDRCRYRIVRFYSKYNSINRQQSYPVVIYCPETNQWIRCDDLNTDYLWFESTITAYNGKLYWVNTSGKYLIMYDPFDMRQTSVRLMDCPNSHDLWYSRRSHVGECEGVLRVMRLEPLELHQRTFKGINLWELQEEEVIFKKHIVFNEGISKSCVGVAGFHPRNKDVLFLIIRDSLASFNTKTRELKVEKLNSYDYQYVFTLQLPWWPTPIPSPSSPAL